MSVSAWIARRYFFSRHKHRFLPLLTATSIASIAIGIFALVVVLSVMKGFNRELTDRLLGLNAHLTIRPPVGTNVTREEMEQWLADTPLRDVVPVVEGEVIAEHRAGEETTVHGTRLRGIDPANIGAMERVEFYFPRESFAALEKGGVILGVEVANSLLVHPDFDQEIELIAPLAEIGPLGDFAPRGHRFPVVGLFRAGVYEYDGSYALTSLLAARKLLGQQAREGWQVRLEDPERAALVVRDLRRRLPPEWSVVGWDEQNQKLFSALKLERAGMTAILLLVVLIASFSIAGCCLLLVVVKRRDMALLGTLGATTGAIQRIFVFHGAWIGVIGSVLGGAMGVVICVALTRWPMALPSSYYLDQLPVELSPLAVGGFVIAGVLVATLASLYPVLRVCKEEVVEVLRYE